MILTGNCLDVLPTLQAKSIQTVVTSPPYYNLRDYQTGTWTGGDPACDHRKRNRPSYATSGLNSPEKSNTDHRHEGYGTFCGRCGAERTDDQIGLEQTPDEYVAKLVEVFREVRRVLRDDGTLWLNIGDSYNNRKKIRRSSHRPGFNSWSDDEPWVDRAANGGCRMSLSDGDLKEKDLLGIPWMLAFALRADGWYLRSDIIWHKQSVMPESIKDRPTNCHEHVFLLSKNPHYYYDAAAIREPADAKSANRYRWKFPGNPAGINRTHALRGPEGMLETDGTRNCRNVWTINHQNYKGGHFATMPMALAERCILAGTSAHGCCSACGSPYIRQLSKPTGGFTKWHDHTDDLVKGQRKPGGQKYWDSYVASSTLGWSASCQCNAAVIPCTVLDPFAGVGTTAIAAYKHDRSAVMIELNEGYVELMKQRLGMVPFIVLGSEAA